MRVGITAQQQHSARPDGSQAGRMHGTTIDFWNGRRTRGARTTRTIQHCDVLNIMDDGECEKGDFSVDSCSGFWHLYIHGRIDQVQHGIKHKEILTSKKLSMHWVLY